LSFRPCIQALESRTMADKKLDKKTENEIFFVKLDSVLEAQHNIDDEAKRFLSKTVGKKISDMLMTSVASKKCVQFNKFFKRFIAWSIKYLNLPWASCVEVRLQLFIEYICTVKEMRL